MLGQGRAGIAERLPTKATTDGEGSRAHPEGVRGSPPGSCASLLRKGVTGKAGRLSGRPLASEFPQFPAGGESDGLCSSRCGHHRGHDGCTMAGRYGARRCELEQGRGDRERLSGRVQGTPGAWRACSLPVRFSRLIGWASSHNIPACTNRPPNPSHDLRGPLLPLSCRISPRVFARSLRLQRVKARLRNSLRNSLRRVDDDARVIEARIAQGHRVGLALRLALATVQGQAIAVDPESELAGLAARCA